jgi:hypothetical protein
MGCRSYFLIFVKRGNAAPCSVRVRGDKEKPSTASLGRLGWLPGAKRDHTNELGEAAEFGKFQILRVG